MPSLVTIGHGFRHDVAHRAFVFVALASKFGEEGAQRRWGDERCGHHHQGDGAVETTGEDSRREADLREDEADFASGDHPHADDDLAERTAERGVAGEEFAGDGNDREQQSDDSNNTGMSSRRSRSGGM